MGTINYFTSDYITIGYNLNNIDDIEIYSDFIQDDFDNVQELLKDYNFYYFHVTIKPGYYEGFSIDIEFNFGWYFDGWQDRAAAQKEITRLKAFLIECIQDFNCCAVAPGWCTAYYDYKTTLKKLNDAIKEMRATVNNTPTFYKLRAAGEI
jgi:hypothetical protein